MVRLFLMILFSCMSLVLNATQVNIQLPALEKRTTQQGEQLPTAYLGDTISIEVIVSDGDRNTGDVQIENIDQFSVLGQSRSTSISMINGQYSSETRYTFDVSAKAPGVLQFGPAYVDQQGKRIESQQVTLQVVDEAPADRPAQSNVSSAGEQEYIRPEAFCEVYAPKKKYYLGEPIELRAVAFLRGPIVQAGFNFPKFKGFYQKEVAHIARGKEEIQGKEYDILEKKFILFPLQAGEKAIDPVTFAYTFQTKPPKRKKRRGFFADSFFDDLFGQARIKQSHTLSKLLKFSVESLPKTKGYVDGVGSFNTFSATVDKTGATVNEPVIVRFTVEGKGNLDQIPELNLSLPAQVKSYKSKTHVKEDLSREYVGGEKVFEYVVQATQAGDLTIPAQTFRYFDPKHGEYKTLRSEPINLTITPSQDAPVQQQDFDEPMEEQDTSRLDTPRKNDIHFIEEDGFAARTVPPAIPLWIFIIFLTLPFFIFRTVVVKKIKALFFRGWSDKRRRKRHLASFEKKLKQQRGETLYHFFMQFLSVKFNAQTMHEVTEQWIKDVLRQAAMQEEKIEEFLDFLNECASMHFIKNSKSDDEQKILLKKAGYWFLLLNK